MGELRITRDKLESIQQKLAHYLLDSGYEGSLEDGTGAYDILVKGNALITLFLNDQVEKTRGYLSLKEAEKFKDILGDEYDDAVDSILSNWFVSRKPGSEARVIIRMWFSRAVEYISLEKDTTVAHINGHEFKTYRKYQITSEDFNTYINPSIFLEEFYYDIEAYSTEAGEKNDLVLGQKVGINQINPYLLRAELYEILSKGENIESSDKFIARTQKAANTRELITYRAIETVLKDEFKDIHKFYTAGYGEPEQQRDLKKFNEIEVHVGNKADIYVNGNFRFYEDTIEGVKEGTKEYKVEDHPVYFVQSVKLKDEDVDLDFSYEFEQEDDYLFSSEFYKTKITFTLPEEYDSSDVKIRYLSSPSVSPVSDFVFNSYQRVACYSPVIKALYPVCLNFELDINFYPGEEKADKEEIKEEVVKFINNLEHKHPYVQSRLIDHLHTKFPNIKRVHLPLLGEYFFVDPDSHEEKSGELYDYFKIEDIEGLSKQVTSNTVEFFTHKDFIVINERSS